MVMLQSSLLSTIRLVQQADCKRGRGGKVGSVRQANGGRQVLTLPATNIFSEASGGVKPHERT